MACRKPVVSTKEAIMSHTNSSWNNTKVRTAVGVALVTGLVILFVYMISPETVSTGGLTGSELTD